MPFAIAAVGTGVSMGLSSSAASDAQKAQQQAAQYRMQMANKAKTNYFKEQQPYVNFGYSQLPAYQAATEQYAQGIPGYYDQINAYQQAINNYNAQAIPGVNAAMGQYQGAIDRYGNAVDQYGNAINRYTSAIPDMTGAYTMDQYKQSPLYTPMVTNLAELQATPGYQFQLQQGEQALGQTAAARGGLLSGAQQKAAQNYAQQQAATGFQSAWERAQQAYTTAFNQNLARQQQLQSVLGQNAGLYNTNAGLYAQGVDMYGNAVNQAVNRAGLYQNAAAMAGNKAGLYGQGLGYINQNVANQLAGLRLGYGALQDKNAMRQWATELASGAAQSYGNAQSQGALGQAQIMNTGIGQLGSAIAGFGGEQGWWTVPDALKPKAS